MHRLLILASTICLGGCLATREQAASVLQQQYIGQSVDAIIVSFGPPASSYKMTTGSTAYSWQLAQHVTLTENSARPLACKILVVASPKGVVESLSTEDASNMGGESLCAERLKLQR